MLIERNNYFYYHQNNICYENKDRTVTEIALTRLVLIIGELSNICLLNEWFEN